MDKLIVLKDVVSKVYADMITDPRTELVLAMGPMFRRPLIRFDEAYETFIATVTSDSALFDRWLNVQVQVLTELSGDAKQALVQLKDTFNEILEDTPGGETATFEGGDLEKKSFIIALAFRIYLDALVAAEEEEPKK